MVADLSFATRPSQDEFGNSVDAEGTTFVVGAQSSDNVGNDTGSVYVYDVIDDVTTLRTVIDNPDPVEGRFGTTGEFGSSVSLSGSTLVVGAEINGSGDGAVHVFDIAGSPVLLGSIPAPVAGADARFGSSVDIDGSFFVVGAPDTDLAGENNAGQAYVYEIVAGTPTLLAEIDPPTPDFADRFGANVAIDGSTVLIGGRSSSAIHIYDISQGSADLVATMPTGNDVLDIEGSTIVIRRPGDNFFDFTPSSVEVYEFDGTNANLVATLTHPDTPDSIAFGRSIDLENGTLVVTSPAVDDTGAGQVFVYSLVDPANPILLGTGEDSTPVAGEFFGVSAAVTDTNIIVGSPFDTTRSFRGGSAAVFTNPGLPTIDGDLTEDTDEDTAISGTLMINNVDPAIEFVAGVTAGTYGDFEILADGSWTYTPNASAQALPEAQVEIETFSVSATNGLASEVEIAVTGVNDAAVVGGDLFGSNDEDATNPVISGTATISDADDSQNAFDVQTQISPLGEFTNDAAGNWTFTYDPADVQYVQAGDSVRAIFSLRAVDGTVSSVEVAITGNNDEAVIGGDLTVTTDEDNTRLTDGFLTISDIDQNENAFTPSSTNGTYGTLQLQSNGLWAFFVNRFNARELAAGDSVSEDFVVTSVDGTEATITATVTGNNDTAVFGGDLTATTDEDATTALTGIAMVNDFDNGESSFVASTSTGTYGELTLNADGTWTYDLDNAAAQSLNAGDTAVDDFDVVSFDGTETTIAISIEGLNDSAVIGGDLAGSTDEDATTPLTGVATVADDDGGEATFVASTSTGTYGELTLNADGTWTYDLDNAAAQSLNAGDTAVDDFDVVSFDGTETTIAISIEGLNDAAVIGGDLGGSTDEDTTTALTGVATVADDDDGEATFVASTATATYGELTLNADGTWSYALDNAAAQSLNAGDTVVEEFDVATSDGTTATIAISVAGLNDAAVIGGDLDGSTDEDATTPLTGVATVADDDDGEATFVASTATGTYGELTFNADGTWSYVVDTSTTQSLANGDVVSDSFTIETADGTTATVSIDISGSDEESNNSNIQLIDGVLTVTGTENDDVINVVVENGQIVVTSDTFPGATFDVGDVTSIEIDALDGDDVVALTDDVLVPALLIGGSGDDDLLGGGGDDIITGGIGNDRMRGRSGSDIIVGHDGQDLLLGDSGRDLLFGGDDVDFIFGGSGSDLMLGGLTIYWNDFEALGLLRDAWNTDRSFNRRRIDIFNGVGPVLSGTGVRLTFGFAFGNTVFTDFDNDFTNGGSGQDWLI